VFKSQNKNLPALETSDWLPLQRSAEPLVSYVQMDELTAELIKPFDYSSDGSEKFYPFEIPYDIPSAFNIGVIVGASGTGKSTLLQRFGKPTQNSWGKESIASHFLSPVEANEKLSAAGLMSVPEWVKPFSALSNGQQFRANLARSLGDNAIIDEYTSVVDRNVAKAASASMAKYVRQNNIQGVVLATVHRDILEYLEPDWIIDTDLGQWTKERCLWQPKLVLDIYPASNKIWGHFAKYHYLSESLNKTARCYIAVWGEQVVGIVATLSFPSGTLKEAYREHRLVIHPDFQGLGFGPKLSELVAQHYLNNGKRYFSKTSHPRLGGYRDQSDHWKPTSKNHMKRKDALNKNKEMKWNIDPNRWSYSHEYIGTNRREIKL
jgi:ABC-type ATPase involved in cell division/GNAT superfamily N-acetyltransferase